MGNRTQTLGIGLVAGAAGKAALDVVTYMDMLIRGRPASGVPARMADSLADQATEHVSEITDEVPDSIAEEAEEDEPGPRASATGALSGYAIGLGLGAGYAFVRARSDVPRSTASLLGGLTLSVLAMVASDVPAVAAGATSDPRDWPASSWLADVLPHLAYGFATACSAEAMLGLRHSPRGHPGKGLFQVAA